MKNRDVSREESQRNKHGDAGSFAEKTAGSSRDHHRQIPVRTEHCRVVLNEVMIKLRSGIRNLTRNVSCVLASVELEDSQLYK